jgi:aryl-alcohol dehydrogenase-like predicted oxidoreductase
MVSEIVFGGDPVTPDNRRPVEMAIERGLNYLDTAPAYGRGKSEEGYAGVLRAVGRDKVFLTTKVSPLGGARNRAYRDVFAGLTRAEQEAVLRELAEDLRKRDATLPTYMGNYFDGQLREIEEDALSDVLERRYHAKIDARATYADTMVRSVDESLRRLGTDHVDILMCPHGASSYAVNRSFVEPALEEAKKADLGVIGMKLAQALFDPDRSTNPRAERVALLDRVVPGERSVHQRAYAFGLANPNLSAVVSNMVAEKQVAENLAVATG